MNDVATGRVGPDEDAELRAHLEECEECSLEVELLAARSAPPASEPESEDDSPLEVAPLAPQSSDWTVEKIFGDESGRGDAASAAPPSNAAGVPAGTSVDSASLFPAEAPAPIEETPEAPPIPAEPVAAMANSASKPAREGWDFEPADAAREATPPEESLLFAEQALNRRIGDGNRKSAVIRAILWGGSAVAGVGLLGVSLWMAMAVHQSPPREIAARVKGPAAAVSDPMSLAPDSPEAPDGRSAPPSAAAPAGGESTPNAPTTPNATATPNAAPAPTAAGPNAPPPAPVKSSLTPKSSTPAPSVASAATKRAAPKPAASAAKGGDRSAPAAAKSGAPAVAAKDPQPATKPATPASTPAAAASPATNPKQDDDDMWPTDDPVAHAAPGAPKQTAPVPSATPAAPRTSDTAASTPLRAETPAAPESEAPNADMKPIDRIHAATEKAAKENDLLALRRLKTTWKNLIRTVVGPDRARAKRELADCLWDIQALSGRDADQRETLVAYRDYLLSAPAGGADARSAARLRELEDAMSERR